jgi:hypothetical protein
MSQPPFRCPTRPPRNPWRAGGPPNAPGRYKIFCGPGRIWDAAYSPMIGSVIAEGEGWRYDDEILAWRRA